MIEFVVRLLTFYFIGARSRNRARKRVRTFLYGLGAMGKAKIGRDVELLDHMKVNAKTVIGNHCRLRGLKVEGKGPVTIGDNCVIAHGCHIFTQNHNYDTGSAIPFDETFSVKGVEIGDCVWIGYGVTILPGTKIGEGAILQAGSVVHGTVPPCAIAGGNPAKAFASRDVAHYEQLKREGRFFHLTPAW